MTINLEAKTREIVGKKVYKLRSEKKIPAVLYGHGSQNKNLEIDYLAFEKIFQQAGESTIIDLLIDGKEAVKTLISDVQYEPVKNRFSHVDLHQIRMDEEINAHVPLKFIGESKLVKEEGGSLTHNLTEIEIRCLPRDLIHEIEVDISTLQDFDDVITIKDLKLPQGLELVDHESEDVIALVSRHREEKEEEVAAVPAEAAAEAAAAEAKLEEGKTVEK